jgi:hypothetical protein
MPSWRSTLHPGSWRGRGRSRPATPSTWRSIRTAAEPSFGRRASVTAAREHRTVNGVAAHGGSIDGPGVVVVGGMLYATSGYGAWGGAPGNVLLAYSVDGR